MLHQVSLKIKSLETYLTRKDVYICLTISILSVTSFFLGALWNREANRPPVTIKMVDMGAGTSGTVPAPSAPVSIDNSSQSASVAAALPSASGSYVASRNGKTYQLTSCPSANLIKSTNKVFFATKAAAEAAGYVAAKNCKM